MSIITKFTIILSIIFLIVFSGFFYLILGYSENSLKEQIFDDLVIIAELEEGYLLEFLENTKGRAIDFSSDGLIRNYAEQLTSSRTPSPDIIRLFNEHLVNNKQSVDKTIRGIFIMDLGGKIIAATSDDEIGRDESDDEYFHDIVGAKMNYGSAFISDIFVSYHFKTNSPVFLVAAPLFSIDQKTKLGYIVNQISLEEISNILSGQKSEELGAISGVRGRRASFDTYLVNENNLLITPSIYQNSGLLKQEISSPLIEGCKIKEERALTYKNFSGENVLGSSMCLPVHDWMLITEISENEAFSVINIFRRNAIAFSIVILFILIALSALFLYYSIVKNILALRKGAQIIGGGDWNYEVKISSNDELSELAKDFNGMAAQLKDSFDDLKSSATKIKESEEKYRTMFDGAADAVLIMDMDGDVREANKKTTALIGYGNQDLLRMNYLQLCPKENMARLQEQFRIATQKNYCFIENIDILKKDGSSMPSDIAISEFEYGGKRYLQFIIRDVSERAEIQKHHAEIDRLKSQFINVVSHQLRTPLNSVRWNLEVLLGGDLGKLKPEQDQFLKNIYLYNQNIINIISDLFLALEIEEGSVTLEKELVNLNILIKGILEGFKNSILIKKLKVDFRVDKGTVADVDADSNKFSQVLTRLIDNAIKYTNDGGEINIKIEKTGNKIVVSVKDNGIGIPEKDQETLFSKFFRGSNAAIMYPNASGLGLFISKKIVEAHNGQIWFESQEGKGTTFFVALPVGK